MLIEAAVSLVTARRSEKNMAQEARFVGRILVQIGKRGDVQWTLSDGVAAFRRWRHSLKDRPPTAVYLMKLRACLKQTEEGMADLLGVPLRWYQHWEQGEREPNVGMKRLIRLAARTPEVLLTLDEQEGMA